MSAFKPFKNEKVPIMLDALAVENRLDRVAIYGLLRITSDQDGLALALAKPLELLAAHILATLRSEKLPDHIALAAA